MVRSTTHFFIALLLMMSPARAQQLESDPRGAVMCIWMIYTSLLDIGDTCRPGEDEAFRAEMRNSIDRIEAFIFRNSEFTADQLNTIRGRQRSLETRVCEGPRSSLRHYEEAVARGLEKMNKGLDELLAVERPPLWNPCL